MKTEELKNIIKEAISKEIKSAILENISEEVYIIKNKEGEPIEQFETQEEAEKALEVYKKENPDQELIIEKGKKLSFEELDSMSEKLENMENMNETTHKGHFTMEQVLKLAKKAGKVVLDAQDALEELCEMYGDKVPASRVFEILDDYDMPELKSKIKVKKVEPKEGNAFTGALAKAKEDGDDSFTVDGKEFDVEEGEGVCMECGDNYMKEESKMCEKCGKELCECGMEEGEISEGLSEKGVETVKMWCEDKGCRTAAKKLIDYALSRKVGLTSADLADTATFANGLDEIETILEDGDYNLAFSLANDVASDMLADEGFDDMGGFFESKKPSIRLTETELLNLIKKMVNEAVPGLDVYKQSHKESGSQNDEALSDVEKKIKSYLDFDGNDNPEFPHQVGGEVKARRADSEESDEVATNRGGGLEDLVYDVEPSKEAQERHKKALTGDSTMGNSQDAANVVPSKLGEKIIKKVKRKDEEEADMPMYKKDKQPVEHVNESKEAENKIISEEIKRMKEMVAYNKKTQ